MDEETGERLNDYVPALPLSDAITKPDADSDPARYARHLRVAAKPQTARDFAAIVQALDEVLHAAIETGNPVIWC